MLKWNSPFVTQDKYLPFSLIFLSKYIALYVLSRPMYSRVQKGIEIWSVWTKLALGEVGLSLP